MVARLACCLVAALAVPAIAAPPPLPAPAPAPAPAIDATTDHVRVDGDAAIPVDTLFGVGEATLTQGAPRVLDAIAAALRKRGDVTILIDVHTDDTAPDDDHTGGYLHKLSQARADAIRGYLIKRGVPARRITARGRSAEAPVASNRTAEGRRANRRVEVALEPDVRPPTAADLATYLKAVRGTGDAVIATIATSAGTLHCTLRPDRAPATVANFIGLATGQKPWTDPKTGKTVHGRPFYNGLTFHRVIPGFMIQGGDPAGAGTGGPGYKFADEIAPDLVHQPGALAMANAGPNTNGSQFFIDEVRVPHLDGHYTIFGQCDEVAVVTKIAGVPRGAGDRPVKPVVIRRVTFARAPAAGPADPYR